MITSPFTVELTENLTINFHQKGSFFVIPVKILDNGTVKRKAEIITIKQNNCSLLQLVLLYLH